MKTFRGCGTALVTPFTHEGDVDEKRLREFVEFQLREGVDFLVPCGTTGESATLSLEEQRRVVEIVVSQTAGRVPVMAGAGGADTRKVIQTIREMEQMGAEGILSVSPYYNKPSQEGIFQHYRALAQATSLPVFVYNVPGRTSSNVEPETILRLAEAGLAGVKEASSNVSQVSEILAHCPDHFQVLSGDDQLTLPIIALGGTGVISVASNEVPGEMTRLARLCLQGDFAQARSVNARLLPLMKINFVESNPVPVKAALSLMGLMEEVYRLPLVPLRAENKAKVRQVLESLALLTTSPYEFARTDRKAI